MKTPSRKLRNARNNGSRDNCEISREFTLYGFALVAGRSEKVLGRHREVFLSRWATAGRPLLIAECVSCGGFQRGVLWNGVWTPEGFGVSPRGPLVTVVYFKALLSSPCSLTFGLSTRSGVTLTLMAQWLLYVPPGLTFTKPMFCPHSAFMCFVWIWEQTAIISLYSINWLVFIAQTKCLLRGTDWVFE